MKYALTTAVFFLGLSVGIYYNYSKPIEPSVVVTPPVTFTLYDNQRTVIETAGFDSIERCRETLALIQWTLVPNGESATCTVK
jgi:hypothetical protein